MRLKDVSARPSQASFDSKTTVRKRMTTNENQQRSEPASASTAGKPLFRAAVSAHAGHRRYGTVLLARPVSYAFLTLLFTVVSAALIIFFTSFSYTRKAQIPGVLLP